MGFGLACHRPVPSYGQVYKLSPAGKLEPAELSSQSSGGELPGSQEPAAARLMAPCPTVDVVMNGVSVSCLLDTGSMVSTVTETFFHEHFAPWGPDRLNSCHWLQVRATNGLAIPYIGYLEVGIVLCGKEVPRCGVLVVKDEWWIFCSWYSWDECHPSLFPTALWGKWALLV